MKKRLHIFVMLLCPPFFFATLIAQNTKNPCHAHEVLTRQLAADPSLQKRVEANERFIAAFANRAQMRGGKQIIIPTVIHVISQSVTDAQVVSQIDALNRDFNKLNADASKVPSAFTNLTADCEIKFQLAARTPENDATNGIIRHTSSRTEWGGQDDVKRPARGGFAPWNPSKYLNIYVCPIGNGVLGYASFPGTPDEVDGVVIDPTVFGTTGSARRPFNLGRTCVHEVAHWLNLYHIWGDSQCGDDHCSDTPTQKEAHYGDVSGATFSNCGATQTRDMNMNFMDYVNDGSMVMFTVGQKARMQATLNGIRASILTSDGCIPPVRTSCNIKNFFVSELKTTAATLTWDAISGTKTYTIDIQKSGANDWTSTTCTNSTITFSNLAANESYAVRIKGDCPTAEYSDAVNFTMRPAAKGTDDYELNNTKSDAKELQLNTTISAQISDEKDVDWFSITTKSGATNVEISLTNLAADYDVRVYDAEGKPLKLSANKGYDNELIRLNSAVETTYFIQIYGYNKAFDGYNNYKLTTISSAKPFTFDASAEAFSKTARSVEEGSFQIFPNPVMDEANFFFDTKGQGKMTLEIMDADGKIVVQKSKFIGKEDPSVSVDVSTLSSGIYIAKTELNGQIMTKKLIKN